jgi:hypothetical protein
VTVPTGTPISPAISDSDLSARSRSTSTDRCSGVSPASTSRTVHQCRAVGDTDAPRRRIAPMRTPDHACVEIRHTHQSADPVQRIRRTTSRGNAQGRVASRFQWSCVQSATPAGCVMWGRGSTSRRPPKLENLEQGRQAVGRRAPAA